MSNPRDWRSILVGVSLGAAVLAIAGAAYAFVVNIEQGREITQVDKSACHTNPAGRECQVTNQESALDASIYTTCIPFRRVGYLCPKPGSTAAKQAKERAEGLVLSTGNSPSSRPEPPVDGSTGEHHAVSAAPHSTPQTHTTSPSPTPGNVGSEAPQPKETPSSLGSTPASEEPTAPTTTPAPEPTQPIRETLAPVLETVHGTVCSLPIRLCP